MPKLELENKQRRKESFIKTKTSYILRYKYRDYM